MEREQIGADPKEELINIITSELSALRRKLNELKSQIEQTQIMVDREQQRNTDIATDLQNIHINLDTVPREDIRDKYDDALDARFRLATMRGQLEKFEANYEQSQTQQQLLNQVLTKLQGVGDIEVEDAPEVGGRGATNIVRIVQAQEEERQRLARQMHDGPAQSLTNFILQTEICQRLFDRNPDRAGEELNNLKNAASITFQKVRDFIFDLRPMMLDDLGVVPTVRRFVDSFREKNDIATELEIIGEERRLESHREVIIFRSIQELMRHGRDYAAATELHIRLDMSGNMIRMVITDNGRGFDVETVFNEDDSHNDDPRAQGLVALKERFDLIAGSMRVTSSEANGTVVTLELPAND